MSDPLTEQNSHLEKILKEYGGMIRAAVHKATRGQPFDEDIVSEVYFAVFLTLRKFGTGWTPPRSFIFSVVKNKVNDFLRQKYREINRITEIKKHLEEQARQREEVITKIHCLTTSEFRVFRLLGLGMTNSEIAENLHVSLFTVRSHLKKIHAKCGLRDRLKLALIAHQVCHQERPDEREGERQTETPTRMRRRKTERLSERRHPELWQPEPPPLPIAVEMPTKYFS